MSAAYEHDRQRLDGRRHQAHREAERRYRLAREAELALWRHSSEALAARLERAKRAVNAVLDPSGNFSDTAKARAAKAEFDTVIASLVALEQPSDRPLRAQLDREIQDADRAYHAELAALRTQHGITAVPAPR